MMINGAHRESTSCCGCTCFIPTPMKVTMVVAGVVLALGSVLTAMYQVNALTTFTLAGTGGGLILFPLSAPLCPQGPDMNPPPYQPQFSENSFSNQPEGNFQPVEEVRAQRIEYDKDDQIKRFEQVGLLKADVNYNIALSYFHIDDFAGFPTNKARIKLQSGKETNGAIFLQKLILIKWPNNLQEIEWFWRLAAEQNVGGIVRLGPLHEADYTENLKTLEYGKHTDTRVLIKKAQDADQALTDSALQFTQYKITYAGNTWEFPIYTLSHWDNFATDKFRELYSLILQVNQFDGHVIIHCEQGTSYTGIFAACWRMQQLQELGEEVDPVEVVREVRSARIGSVEDAEQFEMVLRYADFLNGMLPEELA